MANTVVLIVLIASIATFGLRPSEHVSVAASSIGQALPSLGDVNCDEQINSIDAELILQYHAGLIASLPRQADVNGDRSINSIDALFVLWATAGQAGLVGPGCIDS